MAYKDPARELGKVKTESATQARARRERERRGEISERAEYLLDNDPDIDNMLDARRAAKEQIEAEREYEAGVRKGTVDAKTGRPTRRKKDSPQRGEGSRRRSAQRTSPRRGPKSGSAGRRADRFVSRSVEMVAAPYGSVASAAWTIAMGGLSVVLLYVLMSREGTGLVVALLDGISRGFRRFTDPWVPLFPTKKEAAAPPATLKPANTKKPSGKPTYKEPVGIGGRAA